MSFPLVTVVSCLTYIRGVLSLSTDLTLDPQEGSLGLWLTQSEVESVNQRH